MPPNRSDDWRDIPPQGWWMLCPLQGPGDPSTTVPEPFMPTAPKEVSNVGHGHELRPDANPLQPPREVMSANEERGDEAQCCSQGNLIPLPLPLPGPRGGRSLSAASGAQQLSCAKEGKKEEKNPAQARQTINKSWRSGRQQPQGLSEAARKAGARWLRHSMPLCFPKKHGYP